MSAKGGEGYVMRVKPIAKCVADIMNVIRCFRPESLEARDKIRELLEQYTATALSEEKAQTEAAPTRVEERLTNLEEWAKGVTEWTQQCGKWAAGGR
jgi:hypothetical protein